MIKTMLNLQDNTILITGAAGFIGAALTERVCRENPSAQVIGIDSVNDYYDVSLKEYRLTQLAKLPNFTFIKGNLANKKLIDEIFAKYEPQMVVNLAAQAGVRYSITNPDAYIEANLIVFYNILEACRHSYDNGKPGVEHLVYASSSPSMAPTKKCPMLLRIKWITRCHSMPLRKNPMNFWPMRMPNYTTSPVLAYVSLQYMAQPDGPTWHISGLPINSSKAKKLKSITLATANVILPM